MADHYCEAFFVQPGRCWRMVMNPDGTGHPMHWSSGVVGSRTDAGAGTCTLSPVMGSLMDCSTCARSLLPFPFESPVLNHKRDDGPDDGEITRPEHGSLITRLLPVSECWGLLDPPSSTFADSSSQQRSPFPRSWRTFALTGDPALLLALVRACCDESSSGSWHILAPDPWRDRRCNLLGDWILQADDARGCSHDPVRHRYFRS